MFSPFSSLRIRLFGIVLLVALPLLALVLVSGIEQRRQAEARSLTEARRLTDLACASIDEAVRDSRAFLGTLAQVPEVQRGDAAACGRLFRELLLRQGGAATARLYVLDNERALARGAGPYVNIALADREGRVVASAVPLPGPVSIADRPYFRRALAQHSFAIGGYQTGRITRRPGLNVGYPVRGPDGTPRGVVYAALDLGWLSTAPLDAPLPPGAVLVMIDRRGTILARHPDAEHWVGHAVPDAPAVRAILARREGVTTAAGLTGTKRLWTFRPVAGATEAEAYVALGLIPHDVFAEADQGTRRAIVALVVGVVAAALLTSFWTRSLVLRPIDAMLATTRRLESGDMSARTGVSEAGELGHLGRAFDAMAVGLEARQKELEQTAAALRASNETLEAVLTASPAAIVALDCERRVTLWTMGAERLFGWSAAEMMGRIQPDYIPPEERRTSSDLACRALAGERLIDVPVQRRRQDGRVLELSLSTAPLRDSDGRICGVVVIYVDLTARNQLERQLHHAQKMEAIGRLAGGVAHDFNNLLTVIQGFTELVLHREQLDPASSRDLQEVHRAALRAASLTGQLLTFSRRQPARPRVVDLNNVVADMTNMLRRLIGEDIKLETRLGSRLERTRVDPGSIEQVIANLAVNARDAMPGGGRLRIETANRFCAGARRCKARCRGSCVTLAVADTGEGMAADTLPHIFEPFFTTKEMGRGTGLGLATVYGIVQQCGGEIEVESELGRGSTFRICIPTAESGEEMVEGGDAAAPVAPAAGTVLLVEDEDAVRAIARATLERRGYRVIEAARGPAALEAAARHEDRIDLLVTDVVMPEMSGPEVARLLREARPELKVLYVSGYAPDGVTSRDSGLDAPLLPKPFALDELERKVREILGSTVAAS